MKKEQLAKMNKVELKKKVKTQKFITGILIGLVIGMFVVVFIINQEKSIGASTILPFAFLPLVIINLMNSQKLSKELKSRQN